MHLDTITATYSLVTPMFLGGGEEGQHATGMRPPSFKGALRFWWRAIHWGGFLAGASTEAEALKKMHRAEAALFGAAASADNKEDGQSRALLTARVEWPETQTDFDFGPSGIRYLAGQGLPEHRERGTVIPARKPMTSTNGQNRLVVEVTFRPKTSPSQQREVQRALLALGLFGGLGARCRRGLGSLAIESMEPCDFLIPQAISDLKNAISECLEPQNFPGSLPPFTAFSEKSRCDLWQGENPQSALDLLDQVGDKLCEYRHDARFAADSSSMYKVTQGIEPPAVPQRTVFGIPHNYFFPNPSPPPAGDSVHLGGSKPKDRDRRSSPLLIHIHRFPDGSCAAIQTLLPAMFFAPGEDVEIKHAARGGRRLQLLPTIDYQTIHDYLDQFSPKETLL